MNNGQNHNGHENASGFYVLNVHTRVTPDGGHFTAFADQLGLAAMGDSVDEALENLRHTIIAYCKMRDDRNVLLEALKKAGVQYETVGEIDSLQVPVSA